MKQTRLGLALGGGGARGLAHLGVLLALEEQRIPISVIAGTSMGAAMGAVKAVGADLGLVRSVLRLLDLNDLLQVTDSTARELQKLVARSMVEWVRGATWRHGEACPSDLTRLNQLFRLLTAGKTFEEALVPLAVVACDIETGKRTVLREGLIHKALTASASVPGVFSPLYHGGRHLVDGGIVDKLPADVAIELGATAVLAVDTGAPADRPVESNVDAILQAQRATSARLTELQLEFSQRRINGRVLVLRPEVSWIRMFEFQHAERAIEAGRQAVLDHREEIRALLRPLRASLARFGRPIH